MQHTRGDTHRGGLAEPIGLVMAEPLDSIASVGTTTIHIFHFGYHSEIVLDVFLTPHLD